jgi:iron complex outermembrane receptor protein
LSDLGPDWGHVVMDGGARLQRILRISIATLTLACISTLCCAENPKVKFNIPSDDFPKAILEFYHQSKIEVLFLANETLSKIKTKPVSGEFEPRDALEQMLKDTGLTFRFVTEHSVTIKQTSKATTGTYFDIPSEELRLAIIDWARQAGTEDFYVLPDVDGLRSNAIKGYYSLSDSLAALLGPNSPVVVKLNEHRYWVFSLRIAKHGGPLASLWKRLVEPPSHKLDEVLIAADRPGPARPGFGDPLITYDRAEIDATGASTLPEFLSTVPQIWGGGANEYTQLGVEAKSNTTFGVGINIRGIDDGEAVVLINGHRFAASGDLGSYSDISNLPISTIQRIDIVPSGGSTVYGSDSVSGLVNIVTRADLKGAELDVRDAQATEGGYSERLISQSFGGESTDATGFFDFEYYQHSALQAGTRPQATSNLTPWGAANLNTLNGYPGTLMIGSKTYAVTSIADGRPTLGAAGSSNNYDRWADRYVLPAVQRYNVFGTGSLAVSHNLDLWVQAWGSHRHDSRIDSSGYSGTVILPSNNPGYINPQGGSSPEALLYNFGLLLGPVTSDTQATIGSLALGARMSIGDWKLDGSFDDSVDTEGLLFGNSVSTLGLNNTVNPSIATTTPVFNPFADPNTISPGTLAAIRQTLSYDSRSTLQSASFTARHSLLQSQGGDVNFTMGADYRRQQFASVEEPGSRFDLRREIGAAFVDITAPLIAPGNGVTMARSLSLSAGGRYEHYSNVSGVTSPKVTLAWEPSRGLTFSGSWDRAYRPPPLPDLQSNGVITAIFPMLNGERALVEGGTNPSLRPETASTWTAGLNFAPSDGLALTATYFNVTSVGRVNQPIFSLAALTDPTFAGRIIQHPTTAQQRAVCNESHFQGDPSLCSLPVDAIVFTNLQDLQRLNTSGVDLSGLVRAADIWKIRLDSTYILRFAEQAANKTTEVLNTSNNPLRYRAHLSATRALHDFSVTAAVNFTSGYENTTITPVRQVASWTTLDLQMTYKPTGISWLRGLELALGARNVMNRGAPFVADLAEQAAWDQANGGALIGRTVEGRIRQTW